MPHHDAASVKEIPYQVRDDENNSSPMGLCRAKRLSIVLREVVRWGTDLPAASSVVMPHHGAASVKEIPYQVRDDENNSSPMGLCRAQTSCGRLCERWGRVRGYMSMKN